MMNEMITVDEDVIVDTDKKNNVFVKIFVMILVVVTMLSVAANFYIIDKYKDLYAYACDAVNVMDDVVYEVAEEGNVSDDRVEEICDNEMFDFISDMDNVHTVAELDSFNKLLGID